MKYDELNLQKIREVPIFEVCSKLGISLYGTGKLTRRANCWYHDDKHPSMHINKKKNIYKCFVCGEGGDVIKLVQDYDNKSFIEACDWLVNEFHITLIEDKPAAKKLNHGDCTCGRSEAKIIGTVPCGSTGSNRAENLTPLAEQLTPLDATLVEKSLSLDSQFCKSAVSSGYLTESQLRHAAERYRLGCTKDGGVIFWQIDDQQQVHTGKVMYYQPDCHRDKTHTPTWIHHLMKDTLPPTFTFHPCLFGLHLLSSHPDPLTGRGYLNERATSRSGCIPPSREGLGRVDVSFTSFLCARALEPCSLATNGTQEKENFKGIAIVESEKTAVILSEKFTDYIWLSCGGLQTFKPDLLEPLLQYRVIIFPDTDPQGEAFRKWSQVALEAQRLYKFRYPLRVSPLLESHATVDQKQRKIDLVDYLFENKA